MGQILTINFTAVLQMDQFSPSIVICDDPMHYNPQHFLIPKHYSGCIRKVLIPHGCIKDRIAKMASDYYNSIADRSKPILAMCVLKGANQYFNDFVTELKSLASRDQQTPPQIMVEFVRLKSYSNTESTGKVQIIGLASLGDLRGKHLLVVEDLVDTGRTLKKLLATIQEHEPVSTCITTLLVKRTPKAIADRIQPELVGFEVPNEFIIGYGIDYNENFRDMNHVCAISEFGIEKFKQ